MGKQWFRLALTLVALTLCAAGVAMLVLGRRADAAASGASAAAADGVYTVEILRSGFNPQTCVVNRNRSTVRFLNKDSVARRVVVPAAGVDSPPLYDSGDIAPGDTWSGFYIDYQAELHYYDFYFPAQTGVVLAPVDPNAASQCDPLPPTPTPTPTRTATPTPTPTPVPQSPAGCLRFFASPLGCAVGPFVATDEEER
ncbi:MAG: hypothetical protein IT304_03825 [Dehalococcoidia bacterium]|nr:hypothetical protein [Dehalococcoidia bacterium]